MIEMKQAASDFLAHKRIAVTGVSRNPRARQQRRLPATAGSRLRGVRDQSEHRRDRGRPVLSRPEVVCPAGSTPSLSAPGRTAPATMRIAGLRHETVLMHCRPRRGQRFGGGRRLRPAAGDHRHRRLAARSMFDPAAELGHKAMRFVLTRTGNVPRQV